MVLNYGVRVRRAQKLAGVLSYREKDGFQRIRRNRAAIFPEGKNVALDGFADVLDGLFACFPLANAAGQGGALRHPIACFSGMQKYLPHSASTAWILP
jgi:hypothetical protein